MSTIDEQTLAMLSNLTNLLSRISTEVSNISTNIGELNSQLQVLFKSIDRGSNNTLDNFSLLVDSTNALLGVGEIIGQVTGNEKALADGFKYLIKLLSNHSAIVSLTGAFGLLTAVTVLYGDEIYNAMYRNSELNKQLKASQEALDNQTEAIKRNNEATKENIKSINTDFSMALSQVDALKALTGEDGYAGNIERAKYYADQINKVLPNSVKILEDGKVVWKDSETAVEATAEAVKENIKQLERQKVLQAQQGEYNKAVERDKELQKELASIKKEYLTSLNEEDKLKEEILKKAKKGEDTSKLVEKYQKLVFVNKDYRDTMDSLKGSIVTNSETIKNYETSLQAMGGTSNEVAKALVESYGVVSKDGLHTYDSLGKGLVELNEIEKEYADGKVTLTQQEVEANKQAKEMILAELKQKAEGFGHSYDEMIGILEERGVELTELEKKQLAERFAKNKEVNSAISSEFAYSLGEMYTSLEDNGLRLSEKEKIILDEQLLNWVNSAKGKEGIQNLNYETLLTSLEASGLTLNEKEKEILATQCEQWKTNASNKETIQKENFEKLKTNLDNQLSSMNYKEKERLQESVNLLANSGSQGGYELCKKLSDSLASNNGEVTKETAGIIDQIYTMTEEANPKIKVDTSNPSKDVIASIATNAQKHMGKLNLGVVLSKVSNGFSIAGKMFKFDFFANGGFPETGEMFVAREAGPELVGRINSKTAVANNDQIVSGISNGVYNAVVGALGNGKRGNTTVTAIFNVDGKQVAKQVIQAHNKEVMQTGRSPLLI